MMIDIHVLFEFVVAILSAVIGLGTGYLLLNIREDAQAVMTQFKLESERTAQDFRMLLVSEAVLFFVFLLYVVAGILENSVFMYVSRIMLLVFLAIVGLVFIRQWRRSR